MQCEENKVRTLGYSKATELTPEQMADVSGAWCTSYTGITGWITAPNGDLGFEYSDMYYC